MRVLYAVLGTVAVDVDGVRHQVRARREGLILSRLVAAQGAVVSADRLVSEIWTDDSPQRTLASLQVGISRLRTLLEPDRAPRTDATRLISAPGGYALVAAVNDVDAWAFAAAAEAALAATDPAERVGAAEAALERWAGEPYSLGAEIEALRVEADRLRELHVAVLQAKAEAQLVLGRSDRVARDLLDVVPAHPFREQLWATLSLAQYRSGRQADALATLRTLRERLADELGVDPSAPIRELEQAILTQDPELIAVPADPRPRRTPAPPAPAAVSPLTEGHAALVGRQADLAVLDDALAALAAGTGGALVISGEPGIGKSRLVQELTARAAAASLRVAVGRGHDADVAPPFWPWLPILRQLGPADPPEEVARLLGADAGPVLNQSGAALRTYEAVVRLLRSTAAEQPLLVVLEDLHWADASSVQLLGYAAESLGTDPVLFAVTRRPAPSSTTDPLAVAMAALARRRAARISLTGLNGDEVGDLLRDRVGRHDPSLVAVLSRRTGGNPFYLIEMARLLAATGVTDPAAAAVLPIPDGLRDVIRLRLDRMPATARTVLDHACAQGGGIDVDLVAETARLDVTEVFDQLDLCIAADLVREEAGGHAFSHALTRECIYADLPTGRRIRLHADLAAALQRRAADDPEVLAEIAHHAVAAAALGGEHVTRALVALRAAASQSESRHAFPEALDRWREAQRLTAARGVDPVLRYEINRDTGRAEFRLGQAGAARRSMDVAVQTARGLGRWDLVPEAATSFAVAGSWSWRDFGPIDQPMVDTLTACVDHLPDGGALAMVLACLQMEYYFAADADRGEELGRRSVAMARAAGDEEVLAQVLLVRGLAGWHRLAPDERITMAEEVLQLPVSAENRVLALWQLAGALHQAGRPAESDAVMARCREIAAELRHTGSDIPLAWWRFTRAVERDDPDAAALGDAAEQQHRRVGYIGRGELIAVHALRRSPPGTPVPAEILAVGEGSDNAGIRAMVAHAVLEAGEPERAFALLGPPPVAGELNFATLATHCLRVVVLAAAGDTAGVRATRPHLAASEVVTVTFGSIDSLGALDYFRAVAAYALGDALEGDRLARAAVATNTRIGNGPWRRRAEALLAERTELRGKPAESRR